jgi:hypothetical protein
MNDEDRNRLMLDLLHIAEETRQFKPPYIPSRSKTWRTASLTSW